jgi:SAM-dependent methyltransferase
MNVSAADNESLLIIRESVKQHIKAASETDRPGLLVLDVAPQIYEGAKEFFKEATLKTIDINPGADYCADICDTNTSLIPDNAFDIIICTEVLEHVTNPFAVVNELQRILKPGGQVFVTTPFNFRIHGPLPDNWRFTIHGLKQLFSDWQIVLIEEIQTPGRPLMPIHYRLIASKNADKD